MVMEEEVEQDELNSHECMSVIMRLLDHMQLNNINPAIPTVSHMTDTQHTHHC